MDKEYLKKLIKNTLLGVRGFNLWNERVESLLLGTCAQESALGRYRRQLGGGPALGIFQMEPDTFYDIIHNYLRHKIKLQTAVLNALGKDKLEHLHPMELECDDEMAIIFARLHYLRVKEAIPDTIEEQALYYKKYYNTPLGAATINEYLKNYKLYVE